MADDLSARMDKRELDKIGRTLAFYGTALNKDLTDVTNRAGRQVTIFAAAKTKAADPDKIEAEMRKVVAHQVFSKGKAFKRLKKPKAITKRTRLANAIIWARAKAKGEELTSEEAEKRAKQMTSSRKRSVKFIRSGYIPALQAFGAPRRDSGRIRGKPKGSATLATPMRIQASLTNAVQGRKGSAAVKVGSQAVVDALRDAERDMRTYAEKKVAERTAKVNAIR